MVVTSEGGVAVAYMLERRGAAGYVRVATLDGDGFAIETLQDGYLYGPLDLAARPDGALAVGCHNHDWEDAGVAVLDADDRPHVAFIQSDTTLREEGRNAGNVVYGMFDGTAWSFEQLATLDSMVLDFEVRGAPWRSRSPRTGR